MHLSRIRNGDPLSIPRDGRLGDRKSAGTNDRYSAVLPFPTPTAMPDSFHPPRSWAYSSSNRTCDGCVA
jgi:hypothetical protein